MNLHINIVLLHISLGCNLSYTFSKNEGGILKWERFTNEYLKKHKGCKIIPRQIHLLK